jgi:hypothetical protein
LDFIDDVLKSGVLFSIDVDQVNGVIEVLNILGIHLEKRSKVFHNVACNGKACDHEIEVEFWHGIL